MNLLETVIGIITVIGTIIGVLKWYTRHNANHIKETLKSDNVHSNLDLKINELEKDYYALQEEVHKNEQSINDLTKELYELKGKIEK